MPKKKIYNIGLVDADLLCNGTRHPNLALLKIAGYFKDNGFARGETENQSFYELITNESNFESLQKYDLFYVPCVFTFTLDNPPLVLTTLLNDKKLSKKVRMGGTGSYANHSVEEGFAEKRDEVYALAEKYANTGFGISKDWNEHLDKEILFYKPIGWIDTLYQEIKDEVSSLV